MTRPVALLLLAVCATLVFVTFAIWPDIDLWVTALFHDPVHGFGAVDQGVADVLRRIIWRLSECLLAVSLAALGIGAWTKGAVLDIPRRVWAYIMLLYLLGPGLLVDAILKPLWGRARPADVIEFGGTLRFTPPHILSGECSRNCSFTAGEVAGAVALAIAVTLILTRLGPRIPAMLWRFGVAVSAIVVLFVAFQRIGAGRHFLSDSILSAIFVSMVGLLLHMAMFRRGGP